MIEDIVKYVIAFIITFMFGVLMIANNANAEDNCGFEYKKLQSENQMLRKMLSIEKKRKAIGQQLIVALSELDRQAKKLQSPKLNSVGMSIEEDGETTIMYQRDFNEQLLRGNIGFSTDGQLSIGLGLNF